jgi:predicted RNase H-like HicB family nuclease
MSSFSILLENNQGEDFRATVLGMPECYGQGATREAALANAKQLLAERLSVAEIVAIELPPKSTARQMAGNFKDDPQWDEFQGAIAEYRRELDAELEAEYRQTDEAERQQRMSSGQSAA